MLTSSNQYLRPEYLSPLPTTLDAKKSPLALLAQTCSNIGADTPNNKPIIPPIEKPKETTKKDASRTTPADETNSNNKITCFKPYELSSKDDHHHHDKRECSRTPGSRSSVTPHSASGTPPTVSVANNVISSRSSPMSSHKSPSPTSSSETKSSSTSSSSSSLSGSFSVVNSCSSRSESDVLSASSYSLASAYKSGLMLPNPLAGCVGCTGPSSMPGLDNPSVSYPGLIGSQSLKVGAFSSAVGLSPYVGYARVKTATGSTIVPVCKDPYCTNCQYGGMQTGHLGGSTCPAGCTQCKHDSLSGLSAGLNPLVPGLNSAAAAAAAAAGLYPPHSMLSHSMPYVCNWIAGDTYCGKRYAASDELLQHLRTHTNMTAVTETALPLGLSLPTSVPGLGCHLHYSSAPSLTSPAGLRRTYPTALDSLTASRYHPYKPSLPGTPLPPLPHPGFNPYYSPYSMYGQRFGAAAVHP